MSERPTMGWAISYKGKILPEVRKLRSDAWFDVGWPFACEKLGYEYHDAYYKKLEPSIRAARKKGIFLVRVLVLPEEAKVT